MTASSANHTAFTTSAGTFAWWDMPDATISPAALRAILATEGLTINVPDVDPVAALKTAARGWTQGRGNADRWRAEVTKETATDITVGLLRRAKVNDQEVEWTQVHTMTYNLVTKTWNGHTVGLSDEVDSFVKLANEKVCFLDAEFVRPFVIQAELKKMHAISLRSQGGIYFVPVQSKDHLNRLRRVVGSIPSCSIKLATIDLDADGQDTIGTGARQHATDALTGIKARLETWKASSKSASVKVSDDLLSQLGDLLDLASTYEEALQIKLDDLREEVSAVREEAKRILAR